MNNEQGTANKGIAISVEGVSKTFKLPHEKQSSLKGLFLSSFRKRRYEMQHAVQDVSFQVKKGEFFGIVGRNGSGKSTLLKLIAGIYTPDRGTITVNGILTPFIELGVGFNPELSGRDNVFLNGALFGKSRKEMEALYDEIVAFAELERFMDQKLKNYSSGMQVRLAFSIAIQAQSDILLLDEVLAVGDESFQKKCIDVFEKYKASARTIILVTHQMSMIEQYCDRAVLIDKGIIKNWGDPRKIASEYLRLNASEKKITPDIDDTAFMKEYGVEIEIIKRETKKPSRNYSFGETVEIKIKWASNAIKNVGVALIKNSGEYMYGPNTIADKVNVSQKKQVTYVLRLHVGKGSYKFLIGFYGDTAYDRVYLIEKNFGIEVVNNDQDWSGIVKLNSEWIV